MSGSATAKGDRSAAAELIAGLWAAGVPGVARPTAAAFSTDEVFAWISAAHDPQREDTARQKLAALHGQWSAAEPDPGRQIEMFRDGAMLLNPAQHLPRSGESFDAWIDRARAALGRFGIQAPGIECANWDAHHRLQALLKPVLAQTGPRTYRFNAFAGDYARTPFGFHLDPHQEGVVQVVVAGSRRALFWDGLSLTGSDAAWLEDPTGKVQPSRTPDFAFDLQPGDVVFWPGTYAHGMEPDGPSLGLSLVIDRASPRTREAVISTLECATAGGRAALPNAETPPDFGATATLVRRAAYPVAYERFDDTLIVGVCGRTFDWPDPDSVPAAMRLFDAINAAAEHRVETLLAECSSASLPAPLLAEVLSMLCSLGFFAVR